MRYFRNREGDCFLISLANLLLLKFHDDVSAKRIYHFGRSNHLVMPNGATAFETWPCLTSELTNGKYSGVLYTGEEQIKEGEECARTEFDEETFDLYSVVVSEEQKARRIVTDRRYEGPSPVILAIGDPVFLGKGHAVVAIGDYYYDKNYEVSFIDDGEESLFAGNYDPGFLPRIMQGLLSVDKQS